MSARNHLALGVMAGALFVGIGCDTDQSFLFPEPIEGVDGVQHLGLIAPIALEGEDGADDPTVEDVQGQIIYGEVGPTGSTATGGVTFEFVGVGGDVCIFIDPELVFWNQSVSPTTAVAQYSEPDNSFDDADLDLRAGQKIFYTGTPAVAIGGFEIRFDDSLGNEVPLDLIECSRADRFGDPGGLAGRGTPEFCTLNETFVGVEYTVVLEAWATPLDDDRAGYGLLFTQGPCSDMFDFFGASDAENDEIAERECIIKGEGIRPGAEQGARAAAAGLPSPTWLGQAEVPSWEGSKAFEQAFCDKEVDLYCKKERRRTREDGELPCSWELDASDEELSTSYQRCFCGDVIDTPKAGGGQ